MKKIEREREITAFVQEKYAQNEREWQIYSKRMRIKEPKQRKIKEQNNI